VKVNIENLTVRCELASRDGRGGRIAMVLNVECLSYCDTGSGGMYMYGARSYNMYGARSYSRFQSG
jgi:hypothetical protein